MSKVEVIDSQRYRSEYKRHLKKNIYPLVLFWVMFVLISFCAIAIICAVIKPLRNCYRSVKNYGYSYVIESQNKIDNYRQNYKLNNLVTFHKDDKRINVNTYIDSETGKGILVSGFQLSEDDVVVSRQVAKRLRIEEGDWIEVDLPIYDEPKRYCVKKIIDYIADYYKIEENLDFAVAFLGHSDTLERHTTGKYVTFLSDSEYVSFFNNPVEYNLRYSVQNELSYLRQKVYWYMSISVLILFIIISVYHLILSNSIKCEVVKYLRDCYLHKTVKMFYYMDYLVYSCVPLVLVLFFIVLLRTPILIVIGYSFIGAIWTLWWLLGGKCFEKAD